MVVHLCREAGFTDGQILVGGWPSPLLSNGVVANPYELGICLFEPRVVNPDILPPLPTEARLPVGGVEWSMATA